MDTDTKSKSGPKEGELFLAQVAKKRYKDTGTNVLLPKLNTSKNDEKEIDQSQTEENGMQSFSDIPRIKIYKKRRSIFNRHLIPLRAAIIFLYGAGRLPGTFLSVFLKNRGMSLVEFSSVFSVTFISQILCASVSGIVADKIGNSKPMLIFHMAATATMIVSLLLTPNMTHETCEEQIIYFSSFDELANATNDLGNCTYTCDGNNNNNDNNNNNNEEIFNETTTLDSHNITVSYLLPESFNGNLSDEKYTSRLNFLKTFFHNNATVNCSLSCLISQTNCLKRDKILLIIYLFLTFSFLTFWSTIYRFMDITIMSLAKEHGSNYGHERIFAMISETIVAIMIAFGMDLIDSYAILPKNKYDIVYWTCASLMTLAVIASCTIKAKIEPPGKRLTTKALTLVKNIEIVVFLVVMFIAGAVHCFYWGFNLLFLESLKAEKILFGLNNACFSLCAIPGLLTSKWWIKKFGTNAIFLASLLFYSINGFGYSFLYNPWLSLILEGTRGFSYHLFWVAAVQHSHDVAPVGLVSTVTAVSGAIHFAVGRSAGTLGGGLLMNATGPRTTYKLIATGCLVTALMYSTFLFIRRKQKSSSDKNKTTVMK